VPSQGKEDSTPLGPGAADPSKLRESVAHLVGEVGSNSATNETLLALDSLGLVELVVRLEEHFQVEIPDWILNDAVFASIDNLTAMLTEIGVSG
jgi:acyl carrier protein